MENPARAFGFDLDALAGDVERVGIDAGDLLDVRWPAVKSHKCRIYGRARVDRRATRGREAPLSGFSSGAAGHNHVPQGGVNMGRRVVAGVCAGGSRRLRACGRDHGGAGAAAPPKPGSWIGSAEALGESEV